MEPEAERAVFILEAVCTVWFTFEFLVRAVCCPDKLRFINNALNIVDFLAMLPFYFELWHTIPATFQYILGMVRVLRFVRLLHIFRLMQGYRCIQVLRHTLWASLGHFCTLAAFLAVGSFMFGSLIVYAEKFSDERDRLELSIFSGAWWAVVSLTTIGYGDISPITWTGRVVGALCALAGVMILALPIPALVNNFKIYHTLVMAKQKPSKRRKHNPNQYPSDLALQEFGRL